MLPLEQHTASRLRPARVSRRTSLLLDSSSRFAFILDFSIGEAQTRARCTSACDMEVAPDAIAAHSCVQSSSHTLQSPQFFPMLESILPEEAA